MAAFQYLFDSTDEGNTTGYITPLLFERIAGETTTIYTVFGIGKGFDVALNSASICVPLKFTIALMKPNVNFPFGGTLGPLIISKGITCGAGPGTVDFDQPADTGEGVGGPPEVVRI